MQAMVSQPLVCDLPYHSMTHTHVMLHWSQPALPNTPGVPCLCFSLVASSRALLNVGFIVPLPLEHLSTLYL